MQIHPNIVAVAVLKELAGIVLVNGREPAAETLQQARKGGRARPRHPARRVRARGQALRAGGQGELMELRRLRADLHIHTCLSPCGELAMSPRAVVDRARAAGLDLIAVTDHNTTENAAAVIEAAGGTGLAVLPGIELTTAEEVHILGLFDPGPISAPSRRPSTGTSPTSRRRKNSSRTRSSSTPTDYVTGFSPRCLFGATRFSVHEAVDLIHGHGGLAIACHVDRESFSIVSQLGFIPPGLGLEAVEVSPRLTVAEAREALGPFDPLPMVRFSDAHKPEEIGCATTDFLVASPDLRGDPQSPGRGGRPEGHPVMMEDLSLHILDIAENAVAAGATRVLIAVNENERRDILAFRVTDNGRGMSREEKERALDPFFTTKRKRTGLGLPLLAQTAEVCGGRVVIESVPRKGTRVTARFRFGHIDRPPL